jgi:hypothetical protein
MLVKEDPYMSASSNPTLNERSAMASARLIDTVDFPTPPLPDDMAITLVGESLSVSGIGYLPVRSIKLVIVTSYPDFRYS